MKPMALGAIIDPGFFSSGAVHTALLIGGVVAVISALVGLFTVIRGQSFAGHGMTDIATAGGSGAFLLSMSPVVGFVGLSVLGAGVMDAIGVRRVRGRDLATGVVLGAADGLAALFLYYDTTRSSTTGASQQVLFGSIFATTPSTTPLVLGLGGLALVVLAVIYRPLLLSTLNDDLAAARGVPRRAVGLAFMVALAVAVGLASVAIGAILSTALLVGPPATALRLTKRMSTALVAAAAIGVGATWLGILLAYDSSAWFSNNQGLPVSFFIVILVFGAYLAAGAGQWLAARRTSTPARVA